jgi:DNA-binding Xre family transcriptional regulator
MSKGNTVTLTREAREKALGVKAARADALPLDLVKALLDGTHPVRVWRKQRKMTLQDLSAGTGISQSYLTEIETGKKPGSLDAMIKIAATLNVSLDDLVAWL